MHRYAFDRIWKPALVTIAGYVLVIAYTVIVNALDLNFIEPENTVPGSISRDAWGLAIFGVVAVVAAPLSEELLFRGLVFGGLVRWGFWPAAVISGVGFSMAHLDPGTFIPFTLIGMALAWAYWSSGNLWDSIIAHCLFNTTSFLVLLSRF
jgi:membrane protease YdiL (CAAX protease family)